MNVEDVDLLVIGGGKAGKTLSMECARAGQRVAMVERGMIGGTCTNVACIPTKTIINSGRILQDLRLAEQFGIAGVGEARVDIDLLRRRKEDIVGAMVESQRAAFICSGMDLILGEARFIAPRTVEVSLNDGGTRVLRGADVVLNLGASPALPDLDGIVDSAVQTSETLQRLESLPESIIVLGGGYIGCEFADMLNTVGVDVTVIQRGERLLAREDADVSETIAQSFADAGIRLELGDAAQRISRAADGTVTVTLASGRTCSAAEVLVVAGRTPQTAGIGLEAAGVQLTARGFIEVNEHLQTSAAHVWAAGDAAGTPQFTHASYDDYRVLSTNLAAQREQGAWRSTAGRLIPYSVFTTPELGRVGLSETDARAAGFNVRVARMPVAAIPRARTMGFAAAIPEINREIPIIQADSLTQVRAGYQVATAVASWLPWTALVLVAGGVLMARRRLPAFTWATVGLALAFALLALGLSIGRTVFAAEVSPSVMPLDAAHAIFGQLTASLRSTAVVGVVAAGLLAAGSWIVAPFRPAQALRAAAVRWFTRLRPATRRTTPAPATDPID